MSAMANSTWLKERLFARRFARASIFSDTSTAM
jgi:hypothetical protein